MMSANHIRFSLALTLALTLAGCNSLPNKNAQQIEPSSNDSTESELVNHKKKSTTSPSDMALSAKLQFLSNKLKTQNTEKEPQPTQITDLWDRLRHNYSLTIPENERISAEIKRFTRHPSHLDHIQERAVPYLHFIIEEIEKRDMPGELALLPAIESAYRPFAFSSGRAAGLWQFIPSTGKLCGLQQNWWYDGRRDIVAATRAALDHLKELSEQFNGDWELALAAYNAGAGGVGRAVSYNSDKGLETDFWNLNLPRETRNYVPRLLAMAKIIAEPERYGITLSPIDNQPYFASIDIESQLDLTLAADLAEISTDELYRLNPGFNRWATAPDGPHRLNIPVDSAPVFKEKLTNLDPDKRLTWTRYEIRKGDTLSTIASRFGVPMSLLKQVNKMSSSRINIGKHLLIPTSVQGQNQYASLAAIEQTVPVEQVTTHTVRSGDTLWGISREHNVSYQELAHWNSLSAKSTLSLGQKLIIKTPSSKKAGSRIHVPPTRSVKSSVRYQVRRGDSLFSIAERFKVSVADLRKWNRFPSKYLQPGQNINLFVDAGEQTL